VSVTFPSGYIQTFPVGEYPVREKICLPRQLPTVMVSLTGNDLVTNLHIQKYRLFEPLKLLLTATDLTTQCNNII